MTPVPTSWITSSVLPGPPQTRTSAPSPAACRLFVAVDSGYRSGPAIISPALNGTVRINPADTPPSLAPQRSQTSPPPPPQLRTFPKDVSISLSNLLRISQSNNTVIKNQATCITDLQTKQHNVHFPRRSQSVSTMSVGEFAKYAD